MRDDFARSSFSVDNHNDDEEDDDFTSSTPLQTRILQIVRSSPNYTIKPAKLSHELGISITDASAELCGLLAAVGEGSSFHFEDVGDDKQSEQPQVTSTKKSVKTMVFQFPKDFEQRAKWKQRRDDWKTYLIEVSRILLRILKVLTAFGLIISLLIVSVAAILALLAAIVALSRDSRGGNRNSILTRQLRNLCITVREILWIYAVFGPMDNESDGYHDPYLRETAYDIWLALSLFCGHPGSIFFWFRANQLQRRRRRGLRGWGRTNGSDSFRDYNSGVEGVTLIRRGEPISSSLDGNDGEHRGLLSVAAEFLFGHSGPPENLMSDAERWKLRAAVIVHKSAIRLSKVDQQQSNDNSTGERAGIAAVSLEQLMPYSDSPPRSSDDSVRVVTEGLEVVSYFNGIPSSSPSNMSKTDVSPSKALFTFPELLAESRFAARYDDRRVAAFDDGSWERLLYDKGALSYTPTPSGGRRTGTGVVEELPKYLHESRYVFSKLEAKQFYSCLGLGILNFLGVLWFAQSVEPGGVLSIYLPTANNDDGNSGGIMVGVLHLLISMLQFYSKLFFVIPSVRLLWILLCNKQMKLRNELRETLAASLED